MNVYGMPSMPRIHPTNLNKHIKKSSFLGTNSQQNYIVEK
jgi:hypothetical protein